MLDPDSGCDFASALYGLAELARAGRLSAALRSEAALKSLMWIWTMPHLALSRAKPTVHDALTATDLLEHALRPLSARIPADSVAHAVSSGLATLPALAAQHFDGVPFLLTEHGIYLRERYLGYRTGEQNWPVKAVLLGFYRELNSLGYRRADLITPCNQYNRRWEERGGAPSERIRTVYNGVDPDLFPHAGPDPAVPTLSWCGRIDPIKDLETLIRSYAIVRAELPDTRLRLYGGVPAGGEDYKTRLEKLAAELGVSRRHLLRGPGQRHGERLRLGQRGDALQHQRGLPVLADRGDVLRPGHRVHGRRRRTRGGRRGGARRAAARTRRDGRGDGRAAA